MPVDKAFDERTKNICFPDDDKVSVVLKRAYFQAGYEAGQKTISPEVRDVFESIKFKLISQKWVKSSGRFMYECTFCLCLSEDKDKINHSTNCFVGKSIKLLAKE